MGVKFALPTTARLVAQQLALFAMNAPQQANFMGVTSLPFSSSVVAALPIFQQYGIPVVASSASSNQLSSEQDFYRIEPPDSQQDQSIVQFIQDLHPQHVAVVYDSYYNGTPNNADDPYSQSLGDSILEKLRGTNIPIVTSHSYRVGHPETIPTLDIINDKPDLLFFAGYPDDLSAMKDQLKEFQRQNIIIPKMSIMGAQALYELGGYSNDNYTHLYFTSFGYPDAQDLPAQVKFANEYKEQFDQNGQHANQYGFDRSTPHSALSYDAVTAFQNAVSNAYNNSQSIALAAVKDELARVSFDGATGNTTFNGNSSSFQSDPTTEKPIYFLCVNSQGLTKKITAIVPAKPNSPLNLSVCM
jgi:ABC-type branched-subunit amino acid transport system substrate-binding protein